MLVLFHPCCCGFPGRGGVSHPALCVHNGTEFASARSAEITSVDLTSPCAWWVTCNGVYSLRQYTGPFGTRSRAKAPLETVRMMGPYKCAFVSPPPGRSLVRLSPAGAASGPPPRPLPTVLQAAPSSSSQNHPSLVASVISPH